MFWRDQICNDEYPSKIPRMSISTALGSVLLRRTQQEIWLGVYSRFDLIGVTYIHLSLTDSLSTLSNRRRRPDDGNRKREISFKTSLRMYKTLWPDVILVPRGRAPFGQHQESRPLPHSNTGSPGFSDFPSLCPCSVSSLTNLIGSRLNLLCLQSDSKPECRWTRPEVAILGADQKERGHWGREWPDVALKNVAFHVATKTWVLHVFVLILLACFCAIFVRNQGKVA